MSDTSDESGRLERPVDEQCLSDLALDQFIEQQLPPDRRAVVAGHLEGCKACALRLEALDQPVPERAQERIVQSLGDRATRVPVRRPLWPAIRIRVLVLGAATAAVIVGLVLPTRPLGPDMYVDPAPTATHGAGLKGVQPWFGVYAKPDGQPVLLSEGDTVAPGTTVQFGARCMGLTYLAIYGQGDSGFVPLVPAAARAVACPQQGEGLLSPALQLDDKPGQEMFIALFCTKAFDPADLLPASKEDEPIAPDGLECSLQGIGLIKE